MSSEECDRARAAIATRDFVGWRGLPPDCSASDLLPGIPGDVAERPVRPLGDSFEPATFVLLEMAGWYRPTASFRDGELVLFDGMNPELASGFDDLMDDLGPPEVRLDWDYGTLPMPGGELVHPARGITVFVSSREPTAALHVALYRPTSADEYQSSLRPHLRKRLLPQQH